MQLASLKLGKTVCKKSFLQYTKHLLYVKYSELKEFGNMTFNQMKRLINKVFYKTISGCVVILIVNEKFI